MNELFTFYIFYGPPGSGKGTMVSKLISKLESKNKNVKLVEMGKEMREFSKTETVVANYIAECQKRGISNPSVIASYFWIHALMNLPVNSATEIIFDGICRTKEEAELFRQCAIVFNARVIVIKLDASDDVCKTRLSLRGRFDDAQKEIVETRLQTYRSQTVGAKNELVATLKKEKSLTVRELCINANIDGEELVWGELERGLFPESNTMVI